MRDSYGDRGNCNEINASTRRFVETNRPEAVIINGRWPEDTTAREAQISDVVEFLKANGTQTIVLVGPAPDWAPDLRSILIRMTFPNDVLPEYMAPPSRTWRPTIGLDTHLKKLAGDLGTKYLSIMDHFCRGDRCLIRVSDQIPDGLVVSDHDHLTAQASAFLFSALGADSFWSKP